MNPKGSLALYSLAMALRPRWLCCVLATLGSSGCGSTFFDEAGFQAAQLPPGALVVDGSSLGGVCDDARSAEEARSYQTPWCTLARALAAAPRGSTVHVRR